MQFKKALKMQNMSSSGIEKIQKVIFWLQFFYQTVTRCKIFKTKFDAFKFFNSKFDTWVCFQFGEMIFNLFLGFYHEELI